MKKIIFIGMIVCFTSVNQAQNCKTEFIKNMEQAYEKAQKKYNRIIKRSIRRGDQSNLLDTNGLIIINIPELEGKQTKGIEVNKENFFCHLNIQKTEFEKAIILKDSIVLGFILPNHGGNYKYRFENKIDYIDFYITPLAKKIIEIKPDMIFSIYHISNTYWYIKNGEINVLFVERSKEGSIGFAIYSPEEYIQTLSEETLNAFLYFKKVRIAYY